MRVKLIPPLLFLLAAGTMLLFHYLYPIYDLNIGVYRPSGLVLIILGLFTAQKVSKLFEKEQTEIHTFKKPKVLVNSGLFKYTRNPIYLGFVGALLGLGILLSSAVAFAIVLLFVLVTDRWYIKHEEKVMEEQFGDAYRAYKSKVRRWL